jgi:ketosteroid isomerase-like protein
VEIIERVIDTMNRRDLDAHDELAAPDFEWFPAMPGTVEGGSYRGREESETYLADYEVVREEYRDLGDRVVVLGRLQARGRGSGVQVNSAAGLVFQLQGGKISRVRGYLDHGEALRVAGLTEQRSGAGVRCEADVEERLTRVLRHGCRRVGEDRREC